MSVLIPEVAAEYGFVIDGLGTHSNRTVMLKALRLLLAACPPMTNMAGYRSVILQEYVLLKQTKSTRQKSLRHLRELYTFDPAIAIFRALCVLWSQPDQTQSLMALSCALGQDSGQRAAADLVVRALLGTLVTPQTLAQVMEENVG